MSSEPATQQQSPQIKQQIQENQGVVSQSNVHEIAYENGAIQKKVYGDQEQTGESMNLLFHLINKDELEKEDEGVVSQLIRAQGTLTLNECSILLQERLKIAMSNFHIQNELQGNPIENDKTVGEVVVKKEETQELFLFYEPIKAVLKQAEKEIKYESLNKYSFLDDKTKVKVYIDLPGIGQLPENQIESRFLERSIEVKIHDYNNKNLIFAIPKTQCQLRSKESKIIVKKDKIIVSIAKMADADNWHSLHKVKAVGDKDE